MSQTHNTLLILATSQACKEKCLVSLSGLTKPSIYHVPFTTPVRPQSQNLLFFVHPMEGSLKVLGGRASGKLNKLKESMKLNLNLKSKQKPFCGMGMDVRYQT